MTKTDYDIDRVLYQEYRIEERILDGKFTKTSHFILPGLHLSVKNFWVYFVNAYLDDEFVTHIFKNKSPVFLLFKTKRFDENWKVFEASIKKSQRFIYEYDVGKYDDDYLVMFLFEFPSAYRADYFRFLEGEYSKFSDNYKKLFPETTEDAYGKTVENPLYGVMYKTETFKRKLAFVTGETIEPFDELWDKWSPEREIFRKQN